MIFLFQKGISAEDCLQNVNFRNLKLIKGRNLRKKIIRFLLMIHRTAKNFKTVCQDKIVYIECQIITCCLVKCILGYSYRRSFALGNHHRLCIPAINNKVCSFVGAVNENFFFNTNQRHRNAFFINQIMKQMLSHPLFRS